MWLLCNVAAIHELPLLLVTETFSTTNVFKKLNSYKFSYYILNASFINITFTSWHIKYFSYFSPLSLKNFLYCMSSCSI